MAKETEETKERFSLVRIITNDAPIVIQDSKNGEQLDVMAALVKIMNDIEQLKGLL